MNDSKIASLEAIAFLLVITLNHTILNLPNQIISITGSASLLNILFVTIIAFIFLTILQKLVKPFQGEDILDISQFLGGKVLKTIIGILFIAYFLIMTGTQLRNFTSILKITYFENAPECFLILSLLIISIIATRFNRSTVFRNNVIVTGIVLINLLIIFLNVSGRFVPERIFPILGYGVKQTFLVGLTNLFAFSGFAYLYFLPPLLKKKQSYNKVSYITLTISAIYLFLSTMSLLFTYADILSTNELSPIFTLAKNIDIPRFLQRPESLFLLGWVLSLLSYLTFAIMIMSIIFQKITQNSDSKITCYSFVTLLFIVAIIPISMTDVRWIQSNIFPWITLSLLYIIAPCILLLANIKHRKKHPNFTLQEDDVT